MNIIDICIGDESGDGHSEKEYFKIECNYLKEDLEEGYRKSCVLTGVQFHTNGDYTGQNLHWSELSKRRILNEYEDSKISEENKDRLRKHGIEDFLDDYRYESEAVMKLLLAFIKLSLPDLEFNILEEDKKNLLGIDAGYGILGE